MAAPDAKTSPSNKEVQQSCSEPSVVGAEGSAPTTVVVTSKVVAAATEAVAETPTTNAASTTTTVPSYLSSESSEKYVLAKSLLSSGDFEQALELIEEAIQETRAVLLSMEVADTDLHESMAPFHYLYGTTLLYSIEESNDTQMTVSEAEAAAAAPVADASAEEEPSAEAPPPAEANVEDMEIAWENLDTARNILEATLASSDMKLTTEFESKLQLDLAQILLREGDLQRMNGRYSEAIMDYEACLGLRKLLLPPFDRKIADAQYNLGLSYLSNSTELQKDENPDAVKLKVGQDHCKKGVQLYVDCAQTLCGQIASLCAVDPSVILSSSENDTSSGAKAGFKTTGMDEADVAVSNASQSLSTWRKTIASLTPVEEDDPRLEDLRELLDEIQETIDEADRSQQAVREATQLRIRAQNAAEAEDGSTTQIGFGQPTMDVAAVAVAAAAQPMMVVKKKKKRDAAEAAAAAAREENNDAKRPKTE